MLWIKPLCLRSVLLDCAVPDIGVLISHVSFPCLQSPIQDVVSHGATLVTGGNPYHHSVHIMGHYFCLTLITNATLSMKIIHIELLLWSPSHARDERHRGYLHCQLNTVYLGSQRVRAWFPGHLAKALCRLKQVLSSSTIPALTTPSNCRLAAWRVLDMVILDLVSSHDSSGSIRLELLRLRFKFQDLGVAIQLHRLYIQQVMKQWKEFIRYPGIKQNSHNDEKVDYAV